MRKGLFWLLLLSIIVWCLGVVKATNTDCWDWLWTLPSSTYASGIVYGCDENDIPIITIYWDDGKWITIKAMNEWTWTVTIWSLNDTGAYWSLYQWWNNYPFPNVAQWTISNISSSGVDASWYGPWKYNSGTWINRYQRDISNNRNLWWGSWDIQSSNWFWWFDVENFIVINAWDRIWMCDTWYHIPSVWERNALIYLWWKNSNIGDDLDINKLNSISQTSVWTKFSNDMLIPFAGFRVRTSVDYPGYQGYYWTSSLDRDDAYYFIFYPDSLYFSSFYTRAVGFSVRCFKNEYVKPSYSLTFDTLGGSEVNTWIAEENTPRTRPENPTKSGYTLVDWYTSTGYDTVFDFTTLATGDLTVYAKWHDNRCGTTDLTLDYDEDNKLCYKKVITGNVPVYYGTDMNNLHSYNDKPIWTITVKLPDGNILTMMDMNLWAAVSWTWEESYGDYYQWWNNTPFSSLSTVNTWTYPELFTWTKDIYENYRPWHPYNSELFRYGNADYWSGAKVWNTNQQYFSNLWGGMWDAAITTSIDTFWWGINNGSSRQWPCPTWYHVPSLWEWNALVTYRYNSKNAVQKSYTGLNSLNNNKDFIETFKLSFVGRRHHSDALVYDFETLGYYWSSSPNSSYWNDARRLSFNSSVVGTNNLFYRSNGFSIRCFKDSPKAPETLTLTFDGNGGNLLWTTSWTLNQLVASWHLAQQPVNPTKTGATFQWWSIEWSEDTAFNFSNPITESKTLKAIYVCNTGYQEIDGKCLYTITYELNDWVLSWENITWYTIESEDIVLINPTKTWYTFTWRSGTDIEWLSLSVTIPSGSTWNRIYEANRQINQYTITFKDWENEITSITADYWTWITPPPNPTKNGYTFKWWDKPIPSTMPAENITIKATWEKASGWSSGWWGGGWWGWWGGSSSSCKNLPTNAVANNNSTPNSNTNYYYSTNTSKVCTFQCKSWYTRNEKKETCDKVSDIQTTSWTNVKEPEANTWNNTKVETWNNTEIQTWSKIDTPEQTPQDDNSDTQDSSTSSQNDTKTYSTEFQEAYEFAHEKWITTMPTIQKANMDGPLTRIAMAKMLSQYAINVLWQKPANLVVPNFNDVTDKQNSDYDDWVTLAYQLWIMWQNMPNNNFRPNDEVTRAEFATALSRMAYWTSDWEYRWTWKYYIHHMEKLVKEWIITKDDPNMKELRGYVMIMLMRSSK